MPRKINLRCSEETKLGIFTLPTVLNCSQVGTDTDKDSQEGKTCQIMKLVRLDVATRKYDKELPRKVY